MVKRSLIHRGNIGQIHPEPNRSVTDISVIKMPLFVKRAAFFTQFSHAAIPEH